MSRPILRVENLGKQYRIGGPRTPYRTLRESVVSTACAPLRWARGRRAAEADTIWALRDVNLEVQPGEVVGIIGPNGAGKSTLLKVLSRITEPTTGQVVLYGRVGSLLEVGTGFHPELTGRENIYLNGTILGMKRREVCRKFDAIVAFAEVEKFIDTPVKHYSSGMYMRLAFAVAAHLNPEILLVDEVLAVGDVNFQRKCLGKMGQVATEGRTVVFVSHNMVAVQSLCSRAAWLDEGRIRDQGTPEDLIKEYLSNGIVGQYCRVWTQGLSPAKDESFQLRRISAYCHNSPEDCYITMSKAFVVEVEYWNGMPEVDLGITLFFVNEQGVIVFGTSNLPDDVKDLKMGIGVYRSRCHVPGDLLNVGQYSVNLLAVKDRATVVHSVGGVLCLEIVDSVGGARDTWENESE